MTSRGRRARRNRKLRRAAQLRQQLAEALADGYSLAEAAGRLGVPPATAQRLLYNEHTRLVVGHVHEA
jgi:DNA-binding IclR family transcriptional regulator